MTTAQRARLLSKADGELPEGALARLGSTAFRIDVSGGSRGGRPAAMVFSPGGGRVALPDGEGVSVFETETGRRVAHRRFERTAVLDVAFAGPAALLVSVYGAVLVLDAGTLETKTRLEQDGVGHVAFSSATGAIFAAAMDRVFKWDLASGKRDASFVSPRGRVHDVLALGGGERMAVYVDDAWVVLDATTGAEVERHDVGYVHHAEASPDGTLIATWLVGGAPIVADLTARRVRRRPDLRGFLGFDDQGRVLTRDEASHVVRWDVVRDTLAPTEVRASEIVDGAHAPGSDRLLVYTPTGLVAFDEKTGRRVVPAIGHVASIVDLAFDPSGTRLWSCGADGLREWSLEDGRQTRLWAPDGCLAVEVTYDGEQLAYVASDGLHVGALGEKSPARVPGIDDPRILDAGPGGKLLVGAVDSVYWVEDGSARAIAGAEARSWAGTALVAAHPAEGAAFFVQGRLHSTAEGFPRASSDQAPPLVRDDEQVWGLEFGHRGRALVACGAQAYLVTASERFRAGFFPDGWGERCGGVAFSLDDGAVFMGYVDGTLWTFALDEEPRALHLAHHERGIGAVALSRDGTTLATGGLDGTILLFEVDALRRPQTPPPKTRREHDFE